MIQIFLILVVRSSGPHVRAKTDYTQLPSVASVAEELDCSPIHQQMCKSHLRYLKRRTNSMRKYRPSLLLFILHQRRHLLVRCLIPSPQTIANQKEVLQSHERRRNRRNHQNQVNVLVQVMKSLVQKILRRLLRLRRTLTHLVSNFLP